MSNGGRCNIALTGFMGTGKSTVAPLLARGLFFQVVDIDTEIEQLLGKTIPAIFAECGEEYFRGVERAVLEDVTRRCNVVISVGGGAVIDEHNRRVLKERCFVVCLSARAEVIAARVKASDRPLLAVDDPLSEINRLLQERESYYRTAEVTIDTSDLAPEEVAMEICRLYEENCQ